MLFPRVHETSELIEINRDRATYDANTNAYVVYSVASSVDAPASLTFGPNFMKLASTYPGTVVLGKFHFPL